MGSRTRKKKAAAAEKGMKKLYVFLDHAGSDENVHSLYALDIPTHAVNFHTPTTTTTTITITISSTGTRTTKVAVTPEEPTLVPISPVLLFGGGDWPQNMNCVRLDSSLYFVGGRCMRFCDGNVLYRYSSKVFVLDLSSEIPSLNSLEVLKRCPSMGTGKINSISFAADGKIFVLSGWKSSPSDKRDVVDGDEVNQFEIFSPLTGEWSSGKPPPFTDAEVGPYVIVNRQVIVYASWREECKFYSYDLDRNTWSEFDTSGWTRVYKDPLPMENGSQFIGDTIYTAFSTGDRVYVIPLKKLDNYADEDDLYLDDDDFFDVIKYIPSHYVSGTLACAGEGDGEGRMCYVQAGYLKEGCGVSVTMFNLFGDEGSPAYLNSGHYVIPHPRPSYKVVAAYMV